MLDRFLKTVFIIVYGISQFAAPIAMLAFCVLFLHFSENEQTPRRIQA